MSNDIQKKIDNILGSINRIKNKESRILFLIQDTKGNPKGGVAFMYELCKLLIEEGYNASILHDKDYKGVGEWLGEQYANLPHTLNSTTLAVSPSDMIIVPEILSYTMQQLANVNCIKVVLAQAYDHIFETLDPGMSWTDYRFDRCISVSNQHNDFISSIFPAVKIDTVNPFVADDFKKLELPQKPLIAIHTREQRDALKIIKAFYLKYPQFRFITFRDLRGISRSEFAHHLKECCVAVWVDNEAGFGTFPLEAMASGVPVIAKIPERIPEWMDENGFWVGETYEIVDVLSKFIQNWLEDTVPAELYAAMDATVAGYSKEQTKRQIVAAVSTYLEKREEALQEALNKLKEEVA